MEHVVDHMNLTNMHTMEATGHNMHTMNATGHNMHAMTTVMNQVDSHAGHNHGNMVTDSKDMTNHEGHMTGNIHGGHPLYFSFNYPVTLLFFDWFITSSGELAAACVGVFLFAILYEGLKILRKYLFEKAKDASEKKTKWQKVFSAWHILQSVLQIIQTTIGMLLMLVYMTFNVWLAISVSLGSGVGYFLFAWAKFSIIGDNCHGM